VALLETVVFFDVVEVVTAHGDGAGHFVGGDDARQNAAADTDVASERAFFVDKVGLDGVTRGLEAEADVACEAQLTAVDAAAENPLLVQEDAGLLLEAPFGLDVRHDEG